MAPAPILVTGATGNVGSEVVRYAVLRQVPCVVAVSNPERSRGKFPEGVPVVRLDFRDPSTFAAALAGVRGIFLLRPPALADMKTTLIPFIDRAIEMGVSEITFLSVDGAERQSWVPHHAVEEHLKRVAISSTILRPGFFAQNLADAYLRDIREANEICVPAGNGKVTFVDVRDVAELAVRSFSEASLKGGAFRLTGPEAIDFFRVAEILSSHLERPIRYRPLGALSYALHLRRRKMPWMQVLVQTVLHLGLRFGNAATVDGTLPRLLGRPSRTVEDYVRDNPGLWAPA